MLNSVVRHSLQRVKWWTETLGYVQLVPQRWQARVSLGMLASLSKDLAAQDWLCFFIASSVSSNQIKKNNNCKS